MGEQVRLGSHSFRLAAMHLRRAAAEAHFDGETLLTGVEIINAGGLQSTTPDLAIPNSVPFDAVSLYSGSLKHCEVALSRQYNPDSAERQMYIFLTPLCLDGGRELAGLCMVRRSSGREPEAVQVIRRCVQVAGLQILQREVGQAAGSSPLKKGIVVYVD